MKWSICVIWWHKVHSADTGRHPLMPTTHCRCGRGHGRLFIMNSTSLKLLVLLAISWWYGTSFNFVTTTIFFAKAVAVLQIVQCVFLWALHAPMRYHLVYCSNDFCRPSATALPISISISKVVGAKRLFNMYSNATTVCMQRKLPTSLHTGRVLRCAMLQKHWVTIFHKAKRSTPKTFPTMFRRSLCNCCTTHGTLVCIRVAWSFATGQ